MLNNLSKNIILIFITFAIIQGLNSFFYNREIEKIDKERSEYKLRIKENEIKKRDIIDSLIVITNERDSILRLSYKLDSLYKLENKKVQSYKERREKVYINILNTSSSDDIISVFSE